MATELEHDLTAARDQLHAARNELLGVVGRLGEADLDRASRGGWTVGRVLEHVIESEWLYARLVTHLREKPVPGDVVSGAPSSAADAIDRLDASRRALLAALEGVDEESFYRLGTVGHEEYSVLSVLQNDANHDREHAEQVRSILEAESSSP